MKRYGMALCVLCLLFVGCAPQQANNTQTDDLAGYTLVCEQTICPNEAYVEQEDERVYQTVAVYQNNADEVVVSATSNSAFFDGLQYDDVVSGTLSAEDVHITWLTLMGSEQPTEDDQLAVAEVRIAVDGELEGAYRVNFAKQAIEAVAEGLDQRN